MILVNFMEKKVIKINFCIQIIKFSIMLLAFDTGLRSVGRCALCLGDIGWNKGLLIWHSQRLVPL
ncbi:MAG: hypothetical protein K2N87_14920 [Eubacterium sp.]|nr:hypothetical protein [Eubacterium sp.]